MIGEQFQHIYVLITFLLQPFGHAGIGGVK